MASLRRTAPYPATTRTDSRQGERQRRRPRPRPARGQGAVPAPRPPPAVDVRGAGRRGGGRRDDGGLAFGSRERDKLPSLLLVAAISPCLRQTTRAFRHEDHDGARSAPAKSQRMRDSFPTKPRRRAIRKPVHGSKIAPLESCIVESFPLCFGRAPGGQQLAKGPATGGITHQPIPRRKQRTAA